MIKTQPDYERLRDALIDICGRIYPHAESKSMAIALPGNLEGLASFIQENRLSFYLARVYGDDPGFCSPELRAICSGWQERDKAYTYTLKAALAALHQVADDDPWMLMKTISSYPHYTSDIDVLVRDEETAGRFNTKMKLTRWNREADGRLKEGFLPLEIDVQTGVSWTDSDELDPEFVWSNVEISNLDDIPFRQPGKQCDSLLRAGHMMFELAEIRLGELLHIYRQSANLDWELLEAEATRRGWPKTYRRIACLLGGIHETLFGQPLANLGPFGRGSPGKFIFPYRIGYLMLAMAVLEKRAWKKIWGARYILWERLVSFR